MPARRLRKQDPQTGEWVSFDWTLPSEPSAQDLEFVFEQAGLRETASNIERSGPLRRGMEAAWEQLNPAPLLTAAQHPVQALQMIGRAQGELGQRAADQFSRGNYAQAALHWINYLLPLIGPAIQQQQDRFAAGDVAGGVGGSLGLATGLVGPPAVAGKMARGVPGPFRNTNPAEQAAVQFGQRRGVPVDAGTASGNQFVRGVQALSDRTIGGSIIASRATQASADALANLGDDLARQVHPSAVATEQAGEGLQTALRQKITAHDTAANQAYGEFRRRAADPRHRRAVQVGMKPDPKTGQPTPVMQDLELPVDMRPIKQRLEPLYRELVRQIPVAIQRASPGFKAIENIVNGPDALPAVIAEADLGAVKALARGADLPELRSISQGKAAGGVKALHPEISRVVGQADPDALTALQTGRAETKAKWRVGDLFKQLRDEPVQAFQQAVWAKDAGINRLRELQRQAPGEMAKVGRAYLDQLLAKATARGEFSGAQGLWTEWQRLGPRTKEVLFGAQRATDLDRFFLLAKKMGETPNPSGTAYVAAIGAQGGLLITHPVTGVAVQITGAALSKLLHSPAGVRLLTRGLKLPASQATGTAGAGVATELLNLAGITAARPRPVGAMGVADGTREDQ